MNIVQILFYVFAGIVITGALGVLLAKSVMYAAFFLVLSFLGVAAIYVIAGADFVAIVQIMIYVGGVLVLIIFGIMLTSKSQVSDSYLSSQTYNKFAGLLAGLGLLVVLVLVIWQINFAEIKWINHILQANASYSVSSVSGIGVNLMTNVLLPFEIAGILLLIALVGAAYIAGKK